MNFRSRGEVLDAIDRAFEGIWGGLRAAPEAPGARERRPRSSRAWSCSWWTATSELGRRWPRATRSAARHARATPWRAAEARLLAKRVDELSASGPWAYGDVVVLLRATTTHELLRARAGGARRSPPTWSAAAATGASSRSPTCATGWPRWPTRSTSSRCTRVLASPLAGLSLDAVALIGLEAARTGATWWLLQSRGRAAGSCSRPRTAPRGRLRRAVRGRARAGPRRSRSRR